MKTDYKNIVRRFQVSGLLALYLFITLSFSFFLANITVAADKPTPNYAVASVKSTQGKSYVQRTDKAIFKENKKSPSKYASLYTNNYFCITNSLVTRLSPQSPTLQVGLEHTSLFILYRNLRI